MPAVEWTAIRTLLLTDPEIAALIDDRCYPIRAPQDPKVPFVILTRTGTLRQHAYEIPNTVTSVTIQIDAFGEKAADARTLQDEIRKALNGYRGSVGGEYIHGVFSETENDIWEDQVELYRTMGIYTVQFREEL